MSTNPVVAYFGFVFFLFFVIVFAFIITIIIPAIRARALRQRLARGEVRRNEGTSELLHCNYCSDLCLVILTICLPPVAVINEAGIGLDFVINLLLTIILRILPFLFMGDDSVTNILLVILGFVPSFHALWAIWLKISRRQARRPLLRRFL